MPLALDRQPDVPAPRFQRPRLTYGIGELQTMLGQQDRTERWFLGYLGRLIESHDFPPPLPLQVGARVDCQPRPRSQWIATAVDVWFEGLLPPGADALDRAAARAAAEDMDARAFQLGGNPLRMIDGGRA